MTTEPDPRPRLLAITPQGPAGPSSRVRVYDWLARLDEPALVNDYLGTAHTSLRLFARRPVDVASAELRLRRLSRRGADRVLLHREASPLSRGGIERRLLRAGRFSVYDFDDALQWHNTGSLARRALFGQPPKCRAAVAQADRVIAGNEVLAEWAAGLARDVVVIPSCVEPAEYLVKQRYDLHDPPRLLWVGSPSAEQYLQVVSRPLLDLHRACGVRLTVVSRGRAPLGDLDRMTDRVQWSLDTVGQVFAEADVGIGPLTDTLFARGKCAYKLLQYAAAGLPVVASPVGANDRALRLLSGSAAGSEMAWYEALADLLDRSAAARAAAGCAARKAVSEHYSFAAWEAVWRTAVGLPIGGPADKR